MNRIERRAQLALEELIEKALAEAGVAEAVEVYEKAEAAYARLSSAGQPLVYSADSTNVRLAARR